MVRGLYAAGTGMLAQLKNMNVVINNATNAETVGYKSDTVVSKSFNDRLIDRINDPSILNTRTTVGSLNGGMYIDQLVTSYEQGVLDATGLQTDLALSGDGFFVVNTSGGERYTRAGNFTADSQGYLINADGYRVVGNDGNSVYVGLGEFGIDAQGAVSINNQPTGQSLQVVGFEDNGGLRKVGDNLYSNFTGRRVQESDAMVKQGFLEMSNANVADVMVDMMTVYRLYESNQRMVQMTDESLGLAVNQIAKV
jgi:flagellar basal-body rod protein FlgG